MEYFLNIAIYILRAIEVVCLSVALYIAFLWALYSIKDFIKRWV